MCARCPQQWYFRYVEGIKSPPGFALLKGSAYHKALEINFSQKIVSGSDLRKNELWEAFDSEFTQLLGSETISPEPFLTEGKVRDSGIAMLGAYYDSGVMKSIFPSKVEEELVVPIEGTDKSLKAIIDLQTTDGRVIDHKTASKKWNDKKVEKDMQSTTYALALGTELDFEFHVVSGVQPVLDIYKVRRTRGHMEWWKRNIHGLLAEMELVASGKFLPRPDNFLCSPDYCGYYKMCMP